jgi:hypothetical protein
MTRRAYRITMLTILVALVLAWSGPMMLKRGRGYEYLERHPLVCRMVRVGFVVTGREAEFDHMILRAWVSRRKQASERELMAGDE